MGVNPKGVFEGVATRPAGRVRPGRQLSGAELLWQKGWPVEEFP